MMTKTTMTPKPTTTPKLMTMTMTMTMGEDEEDEEPDDLITTLTAGCPTSCAKANSLRVYSESMLSWPFFLKKNGTRRKSPLRTIREFALSLRHRHEPIASAER